MNDGLTTIIITFVLGVVLAITALVLTGLGVIVARNVRRPTWVSIALGFVVGIFALWWSDLGTGIGALVLSTIGVGQIAGALVGVVPRTDPRRWTGPSLAMGALSLAAIWALCAAHLLWPAPAAFIEPLEETPRGCPTAGDVEGGRARRSGPLRAELSDGVQITHEDGRVLRVVPPPELPRGEPQWSACDGWVVHIARRSDGERCVGFDHCGYVDPYVLFIDDGLRTWPSAMSRLEARCGRLVATWFSIAGALVIVLAGAGVFLGRRYRALLRSTHRGTLEKVGDGWRLSIDGRTHVLDLRAARILGELVAGECQLVATAYGGGDPYRTETRLHVRQIGCGDERAIAAAVLRQRQRAWTIVLVTATIVSVPVLLAIMTAYRPLAGW